jgi:WD40 repeat protein
MTIVKFSRDGECVATASERGTLIRVFNARNGEILGEFRRGSFPARIVSIGFAPGGRGMVAYSDKGTVHVFVVQRTEVDGEQKRALATWKMPGFQPAVVDFLSDDRIAVVKFAPGEVEILKWDGCVIVSESNVVLASVV